jgi:hypothetical protein
LADLYRLVGFLGSDGCRSLPSGGIHEHGLDGVEEAKLKQLIRSARPRNNEALQQAIADALTKITPQNAQAWFRLTLNRVQL